MGFPLDHCAGNEGPDLSFVALQAIELVSVCLAIVQSVVFLHGRDLKLRCKPKNGSQV
jgi:hypothetical protein